MNLQYEMRKKVIIKNYMNISMLFYLLYGINSFSQNIKSSNNNKGIDIGHVDSYSLSQLATHDFYQNDISMKVDWVKFYPNHMSGMKKLQSDIKMNPRNFPLQKLEDKDKNEPDAFRRWEYQMRKMQVKIVSPTLNLLDVSFSTLDDITFCEMTSFDLEINIKNISGFNLPNFYFMINEIPGAVINYKKLKLPKGVSFVRSSNTFIFSEGFKKDLFLTITLNYSLGCDGYGGSPVLKGKMKTSCKLSWEVNLIGYILDYNNKELYKVIDYGNSSTSIQFKKQTKY